jgi:hypothetical protein
MRLPARHTGWALRVLATSGLGGRPRAISAILR